MCQWSQLGEDKTMNLASEPVEDKPKPFKKLMRLQATLLSLKKRLPRVLAGLVLAGIFAGSAIDLIPLPFLDRLDGVIYDLRLRLTAPCLLYTSDAADD